LKAIRDQVSNFLVGNHRLLVEVVFMALLLLVWVNHIFPFLDDFDGIEDLKIVIAIAGFVWFSLLCFLIIFPIWLTSWLFITIETCFKIGLVINRKVRNRD